MIITYCANCNAQLSSRKPSRSGASFCSDPRCQAAKQRHYRRIRKTGEAEQRDSVSSMEYIRAALHDPRTRCGYCGLEDAVGSYIHRDPKDPMRLCKNPARVFVHQPWMDVVHPELFEKAWLQRVEVNEENRKSVEVEPE